MHASCHLLLPGLLYGRATTHIHTHRRTHTHTDCFAVFVSTRKKLAAYLVVYKKIGCCCLCLPAEECEYIYIFFYGTNHPAISAHILAHARRRGRCGARGKRPVGRACKIASSSRPPRPPRPLGPAARPRANTNASSLTRRLAGFAPKVVTSREARRAATAASALTTHTARRAFSPRAKSAFLFYHPLYR